MKRKATIIGALALVVVLSFLGTLAFFTAEDQATNKITLGNVDIEVVEKTLDEEEEMIPYPEDAIMAMPGDCIDKIVWVSNIGDNPVWIRVRLTPVFVVDEEDDPLATDVVTLDIDDVDWADGGDGWYYHIAIVAPGDDTAAIITKVCFANTMTNAYQDAEFELLVEAEAVQSQNNGAAYDEATGWPVTAP